VKHAVLIVNRAAGGRRPDELVSRLDALLARSGFRIDAAFTAAPGDATTLARKAAEAGADAVFALGGDGTLREAAQGLLGTGVPLGPLPGGTANVLGLALGLPRDPLACAESICRLEPRRIDVGLVRSLVPHSSEASGAAEEAPDRVFLMMTSAGLDARVLSSLSPEGKRRFGRVHIAAQGLFEWWDYDYPGLEVEVDGEVHPASFAAVSNIAHYGGPFRMAPAAQLDDKLLHLLVFRGTGRLPTLDFVWSLFRGQHVERDDVRVRPIGPGERVVLRGAPSREGAAPGRLDVQVDGDPCPDPPPLEVRLAPDALLVLAPAAAC
jgi:diacylglycerol kinase family enzyme